MSETSIPGFEGFEAQFKDVAGVQEMVLALGEQAIGEQPTSAPETPETEVILDGEEAIKVSDEIVFGITKAMDGSERSQPIEEYVIIRLDPEIDADALNQPNLPGVLEVHALSGPVADTKNETFWDRASVKIKSGDGIDTVYELEYGTPPIIHMIKYDMDGEQSFHVARALVESDRDRLSDVVKALEAVRE